MSVTLLETQVFEGQEIRAVDGGNNSSCLQCIFVARRCSELHRINPELSCTFTQRGDGQNIIWLTEDNALKARLRGKL